MTRIAFVSILISLSLIIGNIRPLWIQYLAFAVSLSLFAVSLTRGGPTRPGGLPSSGRLSVWLKKRGLLISLFAFLAVINLVGRKYEQVIDVSASRIYSLRDKTIEWLNKIEEPVEPAQPVTIMIFLTRDDKTAPYAEWLEKQIRRHTSRVRVEIKNINKEVALAQKYEVNRTGETVLITGDRWVKVGSFREDVLIPGLIRLLSKMTSSLCFLTGHGEPDIDDQGPEGLLSLKNQLSDLGYKTKVVSLEQSPPSAIREECGVLLVINPRTDFYPLEEKRLEELMKDPSPPATWWPLGGLPIFFALDPPVSKSVKRLLEDEGLVETGRLVIHRENLAQKMPLTDILLDPPPPLRESPISKPLQRKLYLPHVQALEIVSPPLKKGGQGGFGDIVWSPLLITPPGGSYQLLEEENKPGPFNLALATGHQRIVFGTGSFLQTRNITYGDNRRLFLSTLQWLLREEEKSVWIPEREAEERLMAVEPSEIFWIKNLSLYGFPALGFLGAFLYWGRRYWNS